MFKAHGLLSLNYRLESNKEREKRWCGALGSGSRAQGSALRVFPILPSLLLVWSVGEVWGVRCGV